MLCHHHHRSPIMCEKRSVNVWTFEKIQTTFKLIFSKKQIWVVRTCGLGSSVLTMKMFSVHRIAAVLFGSKV